MVEFIYYSCDVSWRLGPLNNEARNTWDIDAWEWDLLDLLEAEAVSRLRFSCQILIYFWFLMPELVEYCVEQITFHLQRFKVKMRHKQKKMKNKHHETVEGWGTPRQTRPGTRRTCQSMLTGLEDLDLRRWGAFSPLCIPSLIGTFIYFVRRWGLAKNCSLFSPLLFDVKLLKVRAKGMEAIKLRIQEVCLKRPDISFEERISFQDVLAAQKK